MDPRGEKITRQASVPWQPSTRERCIVGLFNFLFPKPTIEGYAALLIGGLRRAGVASELVYEKDNCCIVLGIGGAADAINLTTFFRSFLLSSRRERKQHLNRVVEG